MKKLLSLFVALMLACTLTGACAEQQTESIFELFDGVEWYFASGAGAWSTDLSILSDGSFVGAYHDSDMGDIGDGYPDGTIYVCVFSGKFSVTEENDYLKLHVDELKVEEPDEKEKIEDGVRYVFTESYGIKLGDTFVIYAPGDSADAFTDDMLFWSHLQDSEDTLYELDTWFLWNENGESGFVGELPETES